MGIIKEYEMKNLAEQAARILKDESKAAKERYDIVYELTKGLAPRDFVVYSRALYLLMHEGEKNATSKKRSY